MSSSFLLHVAIQVTCYIHPPRVIHPPRISVSKKRKHGKAICINKINEHGKAISIVKIICRGKAISIVKIIKIISMTALQKAQYMIK